jgi:hypothetical protein
MRCYHWLLSLSACCLFVSGWAVAQEPVEPRWPKHNITLSWGRSHQFGLSTAYTYGPQRDLLVSGVQTGLGIEYGLSLPQGWLFGAMAQGVTASWRYDFNLDDPSHGVVGYPGMNSPARSTLVFWFMHPEFTLHGGKRLMDGKRFCLDAGVMVGIVPLWSTWLLKTDGYNVYPDTSVIRVIRATVEEGLDIHPLVGVRLQGSWQARNYNRWSLMLEGRMTPTNYYDGDYILYGGSAHEGGGILRGRLGYIGLRLGFGMTWGAPRKPRWMRMQDELGRPTP